MYETTYKFFGRRGKGKKKKSKKKRLRFPAETGMQISSQAATLPVTWLRWWETPNQAAAMTKKMNLIAFGDAW